MVKAKATILSHRYQLNLRIILYVKQNKTGYIVKRNNGLLFYAITLSHRYQLNLKIIVYMKQNKTGYIVKRNNGLLF
jgi:hypothetical protein